jgi:hypothetical protein
MAMKRQRLWGFLFPPDSGRWVGILRIGLGLQVTFFAWSLRADWNDLFGTKGHGLVNRALTEAILSSETAFTPRLGWLTAAGQYLGVSEATSLSLTWLGLLAAGFCLLAGLGCRFAAIGAWFLYLCSVKSGLLFTYGVDNFTTIGLFYLMIAPLPDASSLDWKLQKHRVVNPERLGFHRRVLQLHLCVIYFFGGISKSLGADWWNGNSVWRALTRPPFDLVSAEVLVRFTFLLPAIGILVCLLETAYPVFIWPKRTRVFWLAGILLMHLSIGLTMGLYLFALIMIVLNLAAFGSDLFPGRLGVSGRRWPFCWHTVETRTTM